MNSVSTNGNAGWETVIGLEVHCELATATKLFCGCKNAFGDEPNVNICPVCVGLPGALPVLNAQAVELAMRIGAALHCEIRPSVFSRKNYFYPDQAKDYQISQYDLPLNTGGWLELPDGFRVGVTRAHMEEDTGKLTHVGASGRINAAEHALVDYNRSGVPLVEIVSEPDIRSAAHARAYASELRGILIATGASDGRMEEGSMRVDANVSVRPAGSLEFGTRCEIKNLNSLRSLVRAIEYEADRQWALTQSGEKIVQETRHWDEDAGRTISGRSKEEAHDYRYFPEPDLVPVEPTDTMRKEVRASMPELPAARRARYIEQWGISAEDARVLVDVPGLAEYAERAVAALDGGGAAKDVVNWARQEVLAYLNESGLSPAVLAPEMLAELVGLVTAGTISRQQAKDVLAESLREEKWPRTIVEERGLQQVSDESAIAEVVDRVLAANPGIIDEYRAGDDATRKKKRGFVMGPIMRELKGQGNAQVINRVLDQRLNGD